MSETNTEIKLRTLLKKSLDTINLLNNKVRNDAPIAIIGMSCRLPGGVQTPEDFWKLLMEKKDTVSDFPANEQLHQAFAQYISHAPDCYTGSASYLSEDTTAFDTRFFNLSPREVQNMDPQQRISLELAWEAIERAGYNPLTLPEKTGVFVGVIGSEYGTMEKKQPDMGPYTATGSLASITSGRLSYFLNVKGPSLPIDTACSSSLVALHYAIQSLRSGECEMAIVGGINLFSDPSVFRMLCGIDALSRDGRCKTFSEKADGYGRGEGGGFIILKNLPDAQRDADNILCSIVASAVNHDGKSSGLTVPNGKAQEELIHNAIAQAGISKDDVYFIELHGTGTALGDPIEVQAIQNVFGERLSGQPLLLTGVKPNIGHLEGAAGIVGVIKAVLCLNHKSLPPQLLEGDFNPRINFNNTIEVPLTLRQLLSNKNNYYGGVSSFGFSGCNAHVILRKEEATRIVDNHHIPLHLICISAKSGTALDTLLRKYNAAIDTGNIDITSLEYTANIGRSHFEYRIPFLVRDIRNFHAQLNTYLKDQKITLTDTASNSPKKYTLFIDGFYNTEAGKGVQELYSGYATFRNTVDEIDRICQQLKYGQVKLTLLQSKQGKLNALSMFAFHMASARLTIELTGKPEFFMGSGIGHIAVACLTGSLSLEDALDFVRQQNIEKETPTIGFIKYQAINEQTVATYPSNGSFAYLPKADQNVAIKGLKYASIDKATITDKFLEKIIPPTHAVLSSQTGAILTRKMLRQDWLLMLTGASRTENCIETIIENGATTVINISLAGDVYLALQNQLFNDSCDCLAIIDNNTQNPKTLQHLLAALYAKGIDINWAAYYTNLGYTPRRSILPTYPFERKPYCSDFSREWEYTVRNASPFAPNLLSLPISDKILEFSIGCNNLPQVKDTHNILHIGYYHELLFNACKKAYNKTNFSIDEINFLEPLLIGNTERKIQIVLTGINSNKVTFSVNAAQNESWICYAKGKLNFEIKHDINDPLFLNIPEESVNESGNEFYAKMTAKGISLGDSVRWIHSIAKNGNTAYGTFSLPKQELTTQANFPVNITALDACAQQFNIHVPDDVDQGFMAECLSDVRFYKFDNNVPVKCITICKSYDEKNQQLEGSLFLLNSNNDILYKAGRVKMKGVNRTYWQQLQRMQESLGQLNIGHTELPDVITIDYVTAYIKKTIAQLTGIGENEIHITSTLTAMGCDSLMSLQLKRSIDAHFKNDFLLSNLVGDSSIRKISEIIIDLIFAIPTLIDEVSLADADADSTSKWIHKFPYKKHEEPFLKLYCFPYGGSGASVYKNWQQLLPPGIDVCAIQLPGREDRCKEPFATDIQEVARSIADIISKEEDKLFAFYGHSAGALLSYAVARALPELSKANLVQIFCGGFSAPVIWPNPWFDVCNKELKDIGFKNGLMSLPRAAQLDKETLAKLHMVLKLPFALEGNEDIARTTVDILAADLRMVGSFDGRKPLTSLNCPISGFAGTSDDRVQEKEVRLWADLTTDSFKYREFSGDHFFISALQNEQEVTETISKELEAIFNLKMTL